MTRCGIQENPNRESRRTKPLLPLGFLAVDFIHRLTYMYVYLHMFIYIHICIYTPEKGGTKASVHLVNSRAAK